MAERATNEYILSDISMQSALNSGVTHGYRRVGTHLFLLSICTREEWPFAFFLGYPVSIELTVNREIVTDPIRALLYAGNFVYQNGK